MLELWPLASRLWQEKKLNYRRHAGFHEEQQQHYVRDMATNGFQKAQRMQFSSHKLVITSRAVLKIVQYKNV